LKNKKNYHLIHFCTRARARVCVCVCGCIYVCMYI